MDLGLEGMVEVRGWGWLRGGEGMGEGMVERRGWDGREGVGEGGRGGDGRRKGVER